MMITNYGYVSLMFSKRLGWERDGRKRSKKKLKEERKEEGRREGQSELSSPFYSIFS